MFKMTPNILKNLITEKATRLYPFEVRTPYVNARGELINDVGKCNFCGICAEACPKKSLTQKQTYRKPVREFEIIFLQGEGGFKSKNSPGNAEPGD